MIKSVEHMIEAYKEDARRYDYFMRILASFAEIYNYDYSVAALMHDGALFGESKKVIRKNGMIPRIHDFFTYQLNEEEGNTKLYYYDAVFDQVEHQEYGYLTIGTVDESVMADMISLSVRLLEACGIRNIQVSFFVTEEYQEKLEKYLDAQDINYVLKESLNDGVNPLSFEVCENLENQEILLLKGGSFSSVASSLSGLKTQAFGFSGYLDILVSRTRESFVLESKMLDVVVTYDTEKELEQALYLTQELRLNGFKTEYIKRSEKSYIKKNYPTKYVLSVKESFMKTGEVLLTDLYTNEKETIKEMDLIQHLDMNF